MLTAYWIIALIIFSLTMCLIIALFIVNDKDDIPFAARLAIFSIPIAVSWPASVLYGMGYTELLEEE